MNMLKKKLVQIPFYLTDWMGSKTIFILLVSGILYLATTEAQLDVIKTTNEYLWNLFNLLIIITFLFLGIQFITERPQLDSEKRSQFNRLFSRKIFSSLSRLFLLFTGANAFLNIVVEQHYTELKNHPELLLPASVILITGYLGFKYLLDSSIHLNESEYAPYTSSGPNSTLTHTDIKTVAAHESGHLIMCFFYGCIQPDFKAQIFLGGHPDIPYVSGMVSHIPVSNVVEEKTYCEWRMHVLLDGQIAEKLIRGFYSTGASSDFTTWQEMAKKYLSNQFNGLYFINPESDFEKCHNMQSFETLRKIQTKNIEEFFELNKSVLLKMCDALEKNKVLNKEEILLFFYEVKHLKSLPYPNGEFLKFSANWSSSEDENSQKLHC